MNYQIYIPSHCEAPDYEDECEANDLKDAALTFAQHINKNSNPDCWDANDLMPYIKEV